MTLRVTRKENRGHTVLQIDGWLSSRYLSDLAREIDSIDGSPILELSDLRSADAAGVDWLAQMMARGVQVRGLSPYVDGLMRQKTPVSGATHPLES